MNNNPSAKVHWSKVICKEPENYIGWPTIGRKADGELLVVFSGDREEHICPYGKTELVRSHDEGLTWSAPQTITNTPLDDRDAGLLILRSGPIIVSWFTGGQTAAYYQEHANLHPAPVFKAWIRHLDKVSPQDQQQWLGHWTRRSTDGGQTWLPPVPSLATSPHGPIELRDGRLLFVGPGTAAGKPALLSAESTDQGQSWHLIGTIPVPAEFQANPPDAFNEPHCIEVPDGRIVCLWRFEPDSRPRDQWYLHQSESSDGGKSWTVPQQTPMWGYPPHLIRLHNGNLLATYGYRRKPFGQRACLSYDGGKSWDIEHELILRDDALSGDLGYPASLELAPGQFLTVYYQIDQPGEKTSLMLTRWSLPVS